MFDNSSIIKEFSVIESGEVNGRKLIYLDSAATAQKPKCVVDCMSDLYSTCNGNIHRGAHYMSNVVTEKYELSRELIRDFISAKSTKNIIFTSGATASINLVANSYGSFISKGDHIVVSEMEHHSNIVPWQLLCQRTGAELKVIPFDNNGELIKSEYEKLLSNKTKIVAITAASNSLATMPDLPYFIAKAHEIGAKVMVDACQAIVHGRMNVVELDCDFLAFSGHKLYGPTGIGVLYAKEELLDEMPPFFGGGDMVATVTFAKTTYAELPLKFEAGTTPYIQAIGLGEAIKFLNSIDFNAALEYEKELTNYLLSSLEQIDGIQIYGKSKDRCSLVSFNIDGCHSFDLALLLDKQGVAVRTGTHCAQPTMQHFGITGCARASLGIYNNHNDIDTFIIALNRAVMMLR